MEWVMFWFALECGMIPNNAMAMCENEFIDTVIEEYSLYADIDTKIYLFEIFYLGSGIKTVIWQLDSSKLFYLDKTYFNFNVGIEWESVTIGFRHYVKHPIMRYIIYFDNHSIEWGKGYEEIFIKLEGKIGL